MRAATSTPASTPWTLADVIDLDHFIATQAPAAPLPGHAGTERRALLLAWVRQQQQAARGHATPGQAFAAGLGAVGRLASVAGLLSGIGLAGGWLAGTGATPVNAPLFWVMTVGWQLALMLVLVFGLLLARAKPDLTTAPSLARGLVRQLALAWGHALRGLSGEQRQGLRAALARSTAQAERHGPLLASATLAPLQRFGVALNVGLLLAMLTVHLLLVDLRFGWQSSYPITPAQVHGAVQAVATPWRVWLPQAQPSLTEVATTRFSPGQAATQLPADAARAWWPFLAISIACYGLLLRLALLAWTRLLHRRQLAALRFDQPEAMALWRRLCGSLFEVQGGEAELAPLQAGGPLSAAAPGRCVLLVSDDLPLEPDSTTPLLLQRFGWAVAATHRLPLDDRHAAAATLAALREARPRPNAVALVAPAERDPIVAVAQCLRAVCDAAGPGVETRLLLQGADSTRLQLWQRFAQIQQLPIGIEAWSP